jgi:hypothetical protein
VSDYAPPNPYARDLLVLMTVEQKTVAELKSASFAAIDAEANEVAAETAARLRAMADQNADLATYDAPDPALAWLRFVGVVRRYR